jgi:DNA-directed RNA polymerase subunit RPC12/RpoP
MAISYFCPICGTKTEGNTTAVLNGYTIACPCCLAKIKFYILKEAEKTEEEVKAIFDGTEIVAKKRRKRTKQN